MPTTQVTHIAAEAQPEDASTLATPPAAITTITSVIPVLALHGWGQDKRSLKPLCDAIGTHLKSQRQTPPAFFSIDLPGFGDAPPPWQQTEDAPPKDPESGSWDTIDYAKWVKQYCDQQGWDKVILIGHSFGGRISLRLAAMYPELVTAMALIGSAGLPARKTFAKKLRMTAIKWLGKLCRMMTSTRRWHQQRFGSKDYLDSGDMKRTLIKVVTEDQTEALGKICSPTFLLWGENDDAAPLDIGERLNAGIQGSELQVIPGQGHFPFLGAGVYPCAEAIGDFLTAQKLLAAGVSS